MVNVEDIKKAMKERAIDVASNSILEKCALLAETHHLSPSELVDQLDAFLCGKSETLTHELIGKFENEIRKNVRNPSKSNIQSQRNYQSLRAVDSPQISQPSIKFTPNAKPAAKPVSTPDSIAFSAEFTQSETTVGAAPASNFAQRPNSGQLVLEANSSLGKRGQFEASISQPLGSRCKISHSDEDFANVPSRYRYMYTSLDERARAFDRQLIKMQQALCKLASLDEDDLQPVGIPSQDPVWCCGRICSDTSSGTKMSKTSVLLEGSRIDSQGRRVVLGLEEVSYSLFPGQIVLVEGINSSGKKMTAKRIVTGVAAPLVQSPPAKLLEYQYSKYYQNGKPMSVIVCSGPYSTADNLCYDPLQAMLALAFTVKPDVLILLGPFVDASHPILSNGDAVVESETTSHSASFEMVFVEKIIRDGLQEFFNLESDGDTIATNIVLVPSLQDAHHEYVFPQPPFGDRDAITSGFYVETLGVLNVPYSEEKDPRKRVHLVPNPCMFRINEVLFGVTSVDVAMAMSGDEISNDPMEPHRVTRLMSHMLTQQSFSPQLPPSASIPAQLDMRQAKHWSMTHSPDILIAPSKLTQVAKEVNGTMVINPGSLCKGNSGGTYAEISIHPIKEEELRSAVLAGIEMVPNAVPNRTHVSIVKI